MANHNDRRRNWCWFRISLVAIAVLDCVGWLTLNPELLAQSTRTAPKGKEAPTLDSPLLIDLFEGRGGQETTVPRKKSSSADSTGRSAGRKLNSDVERPEGDSKSPLDDVSRRMSWVEERLRARDTSESTRSAQQLIVDELTALIQESTPKSSKSRAQQPESKSQRPAERGGPDSPQDSPQGTPKSEQDSAVSIPSESMDTLVKEVWGHLPARIRDQVRSPVTEQFLPKYERVIADFYRRLATEPIRGPTSSPR